MIVKIVAIKHTKGALGLTRMIGCVIRTVLSLPWIVGSRNASVPELRQWSITTLPFIDLYLTVSTIILQATQIELKGELQFWVEARVITTSEFIKATTTSFIKHHKYLAGRDSIETAILRKITTKRSDAGA